MIENKFSVSDLIHCSYWKMTKYQADVHSQKQTFLFILAIIGLCCWKKIPFSLSPCLLRHVGAKVLTAPVNLLFKHHSIWLGLHVCQWRVSGGSSYSSMRGQPNFFFPNMLLEQKISHVLILLAALHLMILESSLYFIHCWILPSIILRPSKLFNNEAGISE